MEHSDEQLFEQYLAGNVDAFTSLHNRYYEDVKSLVWHKLGCDSSTQDEIAQQAFINVFRFRDQFDLTKSFRVWLFAIADRLCRDWRKQTRKRQKRVINMTDSPLGDSGKDTEGRSAMANLMPDERQVPADEALSQNEDARKAVALLNRLPKHLRAVVHLRVLNNVTCRDAGALLNISHTHARMRTHMALDILRKQMETEFCAEPATLDINSVDDLIEDMRSEEVEAMSRAIFGGDDESDNTVFSSFMRRLVGEAV